MNLDDDNQKSPAEPQSEFEGPHAYDLPEIKGNDELSSENSFDDQEKELTFVELCYGILFQPKETFKRMVNKPPIFYAFLIFIGVTILQSLVDVFVGIPSSLAKMDQMPGGFPREMQAMLSVFSQPSFTIIASTIGLVFGILWWFVNSAVLHLLAELFGGKGKGMGVMSVTGASLLPSVLLIPIQVFIYALNGPQWVVTILAVIIGIYTYIVLPVLGIARVHSFGIGRAIATVLTPLGVLFLGTILFFGAMVAVISMMTPMLQGIF